MRGSSNAQADLSSKQDTLTFDTVPTANSANPITSGGVYTALEEVGGGYTTVTGVYPITLPWTTTFSRKQYNSSLTIDTSGTYDYVCWLCDGGYTHTCGTLTSGTIAAASDGSCVFSAKANISKSTNSGLYDGYSTSSYLSSEHYGVTVCTVSYTLPADTDLSGLIGGAKTGTATISGYAIGVLPTNATIDVSIPNVPISNGKITTATTGNFDCDVIGQSATAVGDSTNKFSKFYPNNHYLSQLYSSTSFVVTSVVFTPS